MAEPRSRVRVVASGTLTVLALLLVWGALVAPHRLGDVTPSAFVRIPLEGLVIVALAAVLPWRASRTLVGVLGVVLGLLVLVTVLDLGFFEVLDRPFDPVNDWVYLGPAYGVLGDSVGGVGAVVVSIVAAVVVLGVLVLIPLAVLRLSRLASDHRRESVVAVTALATAWVIFAVSGASVASLSAVGLAHDEVTLVHAGIADRATFARTFAHDPYADTPGDQLLTGLRGKDVLLVFVESYGRVAVQDTSYSGPVDDVLDAGTRRLRAAGFSARSAFLTSPTFGAASWLAHSTLQSGLWVNSQQRYDQLVSRDRLTLATAFGRAGWRTVSDVPSNTHRWPEGTSFYHFDQLYDAHDVGYRGPRFSYASMPDQYTLSAFRRLELAPKARKPVMAEIDLVSSHHPWTPLPRLVDWSRVGDGSVFDAMPAEGESPDTVFRDPEMVRAAYGKSIEYSWRSLVSFVTTYPDPDLVLVVLGDHQPHTYVTGQGVGHDVPVSVIAHDPTVLQQISGWGWQGGLRPHPDAPVWRMDSFRDRFLAAYGPH
ncbi:MAG: CDP-alcohol phosphatidyltransferase [Marmoricola sp.]|nr:CDP-alcohol phosphatidyltransferase [Marmoricola sp.]